MYDHISFHTEGQPSLSDVQAALHMGYYYADDDEGYGHFMDDYFVTLGLQTEAEFYRQTWQPAHQEQLNAVFQAAFDKWKSSLKS